MECSRFDLCNASVCPLEEKLAVHLNGEAVCYYLRNTGKKGAEERFADDPVFHACAARLSEISDAYPEIKDRVDKSALTGFPGNHLRKENRQKAHSGSTTV